MGRYSDKGGSGTRFFMQRNSSIVHRAFRGAVTAGLILSLSACKGFRFPWSPKPTSEASPTPQVISGQATILMQMNAFHPKQLTVKAGTTITWINKDPVFHSVIADGGQFKSGMVALGQTYSYAFDQPGTYPYYSSGNGGPGGQGMSGEIDVVP